MTARRDQREGGRVTRPVRLLIGIAVFAVGIVLLSAVAGSLDPTPPPRGEPTPNAAATSTPSAVSAAWTVVIDDQFDAGLHSHWHSYDGPYQSGPHNCAIPSHATVHDGYLDMLFSYEASGICGAGWYSGGLALSGFSSVDARVTVRFRVIQSGGVAAHRVIPMRWPDDESAWPQAGEEDYCEGSSMVDCSTVLRFGPSNSQDSHDDATDLTLWHMITVERRAYVVTVSIDGAAAWTYAGSEATLPSTMKHVVLQQECQSSCPSETTGSEDILVDYVTVEVPG